MKQLLVVVLLLLSASAWAEWTRVSRSDAYTVYADIATIRKKGDMVKMWALFDYKTGLISSNGLARLSKHFSEKYQYEFDCDDERQRTLYASWHSGNMGDGEVVDSGADHSTWLPVPPGTVAATLWKIACKQ
jgi:hypothetical protein